MKDQGSETCCSTSAQCPVFIFLMCITFDTHVATRIQMEPDTFLTGLMVNNLRAVGHVTWYQSRVISQKQFHQVRERFFVKTHKHSSTAARKTQKKNTQTHAKVISDHGR